MEASFANADIESLVRKIPEFKNCAAQYVDDGVSTEVYKLMGRTENYYLRLSDENENMSTEVLAHKLVIAKGVKAPEVAYWEDFNKEINRSFMITREVPGTAAKRTENVPKEVFVEAGKQLALINSVPVKSGFGWLDREDPNVTSLSACYPTYQDFALNFERINTMLKGLISSNIFDDDLAKRYLDYVKERKDTLDVKQACLAHGDFDASHIFVLDGKYSGIIDFGDVRATSIYHDLAHFYTYTPEHFDPLLKGYLTVTDLGADCMEKIEFVAMLFVVGKLWWVAKRRPEALGRRRSDYKLINRLLSRNGQ